MNKKDKTDSKVVISGIRKDFSLGGAIGIMKSVLHDKSCQLWSEKNEKYIFGF